MARRKKQTSKKKPVKREVNPLYKIFNVTNKKDFDIRLSNLIIQCMLTLLEIKYSENETYKKGLISRMNRISSIYRAVLPFEVITSIKDIETFDIDSKFWKKYDNKIKL